MEVLIQRGKCLGDIRRLASVIKPKRSFLIVGAGASALYLKQAEIDWNKYTVVSCNSAGLLVKSDVWMSFDCESWRDSWWGQADSKYHLLGFRQIERADSNNVHYPRDYYTFDHIRSLRTDGNDRIEPFILKGGATITGCAIQFAMSFNTTQAIHVTGCDMYNAHTHFYDTDKPPVVRGRDWGGSQVARLAWVMRQAEAKGIDTFHIGLTAMVKYGVHEVIPEVIPE